MASDREYPEFFAQPNGAVCIRTVESPDGYQIAYAHEFGGSFEIANRVAAHLNFAARAGKRVARAEMRAALGFTGFGQNLQIR